MADETKTPSVVPSINSTPDEKTIKEETTTTELDNKALRQRKLKRGMTFLALQVALFLGALDG
jgi:hypothetical protein